MREIASSPRERPYWCSHPHSLYCNWDDDQERRASALAAYVYSIAGLDARAIALLAPGAARESRTWVAWLCAGCLENPATVRWFYRTVRRRFRGALVVAAPGSQDEAPIQPSRPAR